jgi:hypothetical protein
MVKMKYILGITFFLLNGVSYGQLTGALSADLIKVKAHTHPLALELAGKIQTRKISSSVLGKAVTRVERLNSLYSLISAADSNQKLQNYLMRESDYSVFAITSVKVTRPDMVKSYGALADGIQAIAILNEGVIQPAILNFADLSVYALKVAQEPFRVASIADAPKKICISVIVGGNFHSILGNRNGPSLTNVSIGGSGFTSKYMTGQFVSGSASNCP